MILAIVCSASRQGRPSAARLPCQFLAKRDIVRPMGKLNVSLPDALKSFVDEQVAARGHGTSSEYVCDLIRKEQDRQRLRDLLLEGQASCPSVAADDVYFDGLRQRVQRQAQA